MAVRSACLVRSGWSGNWSIPFSETYQVTWEIEADETDGPLAVAMDAQLPPWSLPGIGRIYAVANEGSAYSMCTGLAVSAGAGRTKWKYVATFGQRQGQGQQDPPPGDPLPGDENPNPLDRPEREWWEWESYQRLWEKDISGFEILNSAKQKFTDPPPVDEDYHLILVIQKNVAGETVQEKADLVAMAKALKNATNAEEWRGYPVESLLCRPLQINGPRNEGNKIYYEVQFRIRIFDPITDPSDTVLFKPLDLGTAELVTVREGAAEEKTVRREATDGINTHGGPVKLDGHGKILADQNADAVVLDGTDGKPGPWRLHRVVDFNTYLPTP